METLTLKWMTETLEGMGNHEEAPGAVTKQPKQSKGKRLLKQGNVDNLLNQMQQQKQQALQLQVRL